MLNSPFKKPCISRIVVKNLFTYFTSRCFQVFLIFSQASMHQLNITSLLLYCYCTVTTQHGAVPHTPPKPFIHRKTKHLISLVRLKHQHSSIATSSLLLLESSDWLMCICWNEIPCLTQPYVLAGLLFPPTSCPHSRCNEIWRQQKHLSVGSTQVRRTSLIRLEIWVKLHPLLASCNAAALQTYGRKGPSGVIRVVRRVPSCMETDWTCKVISPELQATAEKK